jgi:hypothetical protein
MAPVYISRLDFSFICSQSLDYYDMNNSAVLPFVPTENYLSMKSRQINPYWPLSQPSRKIR